MCIYIYIYIHTHCSTCVTVYSIQYACYINATFDGLRQHTVYIHLDIQYIQYTIYSMQHTEYGIQLQHTAYSIQQQCTIVYNIQYTVYMLLRAPESGFVSPTDSSLQKHVLN